MLTEDEAQTIAMTFLQEKYYNAKIDFQDNRLVSKNNISTYHMHGEMTMKSQGAFDRFIVDKSSNKYLFSIEIDALEGYIVNYVLT
jgi:hypothetical protein